MVATPSISPGGARARGHLALVAALLLLLASLLVPAPTARAAEQATSATANRTSPANVQEGQDLVFVVQLQDTTAASIDITATPSGPAFEGPNDPAVPAQTKTVPGQPTTATNLPSRQFTFTVPDDTVDEPNEGYTVTITATATSDPGNNGTAPITVTPSSFTGTILDDDDPPPPEPTVTIQASASVAESAGQVQLTVTRTSGSLPGPVTVDVARSYGTATASDAGDVGSTTVSWPANSPSDDTTRTVTVPITNDARDENDEQFTVTLSNPDGATLGSPTMSTVTIRDDDAPPVVRIVGDVQAREGDDLVFTVRLSAQSEKTVTVGAAVSNDTTTDADWDGPTPATVTFTPGTVDRTVRVATVDDGAGEQNETLELSIQGPTNATLGTATAVGTITETGPVARAAAEPSLVAEGSSVAFSSAGTAGPAPLSYAWDFGDGGPGSTDANPSHTYAQDNTYTARLTVTDGNGDTGTQTVEVTVTNVAPAVHVCTTTTGDDPPTCDADNALLSVDREQTVTLRAVVLDPGADGETTSVTFDFGDGSSEPGELGDDGTWTADHAWDVPGLFDVAVTASDGTDTSLEVDCSAGAASSCQQVFVSNPGNTRRRAGEGREETAAFLAIDEWDEGASTVLVARRDDFPDALAAAALARSLDAPLLLTASDELDPAAANAIAELGATRAVLLGGPAALSPQVAADLAALDLEVERVEGANRFATAAAIAQRTGAPQGVALLALGQRADGRDAWPDALSAGAYRGTFPLLLTLPDSLPQATADTLVDLEVDTVVVLGGPAAIGKAVLDAVEALGDVTAIRVSGDDRFATSVAAFTDARTRVGVARTVVVATGRAFPDGLAAGAAAAHLGGTLLLTEPTSLPDVVRSKLQERSAELDEAVVVGGEAAISVPVQDAIEIAIG